MLVGSGAKGFASLWLRKSCITIGLIVSVSGAACARDFTFGGIRWGQSPERFKTQMIAKGYTFSGWSESHHYLNCDGTIDNKDATFAAYVTPAGTVEKFLCIIKNDSNDAMDVFNELHGKLITKYGMPTHDYHFFSPPYEAGDGYEETAFAVGKAHFASFWDDTDEEGGLTLEITKEMRVDIVYESAAWVKSVDARRDASSTDL